MHTIEDSKPWHRQPLVWMVIAIPFSAVVMGAVMIYLALTTDDGLVADDYYKQGLAINEVIVRDRKAAELGLSAVVEMDNGKRLVVLRFNKGGLEEYPVRLNLMLQHATRANSDTPVVLEHGLDDQYIGRLEAPVREGIWYFELNGDGWKLEQRTRVEALTRLELTPSSWASSD